MAAKVVRAYLSTMTRLVKANGGVVRSFDGDRVMGIFIGDSKNSSAAKCALQMKYVVTKVLRPKAQDKFSSLSDFTITHGVGIERRGTGRTRRGTREQ